MIDELCENKITTIEKFKEGLRIRTKLHIVNKRKNGNKKQVTQKLENS